MGVSSKIFVSTFNHPTLCDVVSSKWANMFRPGTTDWMVMLHVSLYSIDMYRPHHFWAPTFKYKTKNLHTQGFGIRKMTNTKPNYSINTWFCQVNPALSCLERRELASAFPRRGISAQNRKSVKISQGNHH